LALPDTRIKAVCVHLHEDVASTLFFITMQLPAEGAGDLPTRPHPSTSSCRVLVYSRFSLLGRSFNTHRRVPVTWRIPNLLARNPGVVQLDRPSVPLGDAPARNPSKVLRVVALLWTAPNCRRNSGLSDHPIQQKFRWEFPNLQAFCLLRDWSAVTGRTRKPHDKQQTVTANRPECMVGTSRKPREKVTLVM
jgi:hypothetical protein